MAKPTSQQEAVLATLKEGWQTYDIKNITHCKGDKVQYRCYSRYTYSDMCRSTSANSSHGITCKDRDTRHRTRLWVVSLGKREVQEECAANVRVHKMHK